MCTPARNVSCFCQPSLFFLRCAHLSVMSFNYLYALYFHYGNSIGKFKFCSGWVFFPRFYGYNYNLVLRYLLGWQWTFCSEIRLDLLFESYILFWILLEASFRRVCKGGANIFWTKLWIWTLILDWKSSSRELWFKNFVLVAKLRMQEATYAALGNI